MALFNTDAQYKKADTQQKHRKGSTEMRRTKIVCTLGPSSDSEKVLEEMLKAGMNIARLNFSHGTHEGHAKNIETFRRVRDRLGVSAAVMLDTKGPEIRLGRIEGKTAELAEGEEFILTSREIVGNAKEASVSYKRLPEELSEGDIVLIDDGRLRFACLTATGRMSGLLLKSAERYPTTRE